MRLFSFLLACALAVCAQAPKVLIIGDSISIGYTPPLARMLAGKAEVVHHEGNAAHTGNGLEKLDSWLGGQKWDVIHFNFGLHDLKIIDGGERQIPQAQYEANLTEIVKKLKKTGAKLVFATTTPVPEGKVNPPREPADVPAYNAAALRIMQRFAVPVNDLYNFALPRLAEIQTPVNVHYSKAGYEALAGQVAQAIQGHLQ
jgi:lysophospholipase L1-like esterase